MFVGYSGGKGAAGVVQRIINEMPPHAVYIECFAGSGAVLRAKRPARSNIAVEVDAAVCAGVLAEWSEDVLPGPGGIAESSDGRSPCSSDRRASSVTCKNVDASDRPAGHGGIARFGADGSQTANTARTVICADAISWLRERAWIGGELVYCDPPYLMSVRSSGKTMWAHEFHRPDQHCELLDILSRIPAMVAISGYWSSLYESMLSGESGWRCIRFPAGTRGRRAEECLWMNWPPPTELHDYRFLGNNFREREVIKRRISRWLARLDRMAPLERLSMAAAIAEFDENRRRSQSPLGSP